MPRSQDPGAHDPRATFPHVGFPFPSALTAPWSFPLGLQDRTGLPPTDNPLMARLPLAAVVILPSPSF